MRVPSVARRGKKSAVTHDPLKTFVLVRPKGCNDRSIDESETEPSQDLPQTSLNAFDNIRAGTQPNLPRHTSILMRTLHARHLA